MIPEPHLPVILLPTLTSDPRTLTAAQPTCLVRDPGLQLAPGRQSLSPSPPCLEGTNTSRQKVPGAPRGNSYCLFSSYLFCLCGSNQASSAYLVMALSARCQEREKLAGPARTSVCTGLGKNSPVYAHLCHFLPDLDGAPGPRHLPAVPALKLVFAWNRTGPRGTGQWPLSELIRTTLPRP